MNEHFHSSNSLSSLPQKIMPGNGRHVAGWARRIWNIARKDTAWLMNTHVPEMGKRERSGWDGYRMVRNNS